MTALKPPPGPRPGPDRHPLGRQCLTTLLLAPAWPLLAATYWARRGMPSWAVRDPGATAAYAILARLLPNRPGPGPKPAQPKPGTPPPPGPKPAPIPRPPYTQPPTPPGRPDAEVSIDDDDFDATCGPVPERTDPFYSSYFPGALPRRIPGALLDRWPTASPKPPPGPKPSPGPTPPPRPPMGPVPPTAPPPRPTGPSRAMTEPRPPGPIPDPPRPPFPLPPRAGA